MLIRKFIPLLIALIIFLNDIQCQTPEKGLENIKQNFTTESIYIHFDKNVYVAGETIWFKAYILSGLKPSLYSTAINIDLLNDSGKIISKKILPVLGSSAAGEFELSPDVPQMNYIVRAYTKRMMNFGAEYFYERRLQILNPGNATEKISQAAKPKIYFLPEGGNMVAGVPAVIAFKATDEFDNPLDIEGEIADSKGVSVASFKSVHDGMGKFIFIPQPGEHYTAGYITGNQAGKQDFPAVKISGVTLLMQDDKEKKSFIINREKLASEAMDPAYLLGISENNLLFRINLPSMGLLLKGDIPVQDLPSGILQLTLFTKEGLPLAERMLFINNHEFLAEGTLSIDSLPKQPHKKNVFTFSLKDTIAGTFSVAVTDLDNELDAPSRENIISRVMLQNDIKGYIHNPLYYFINDDEVSKNNLDLVMMTNGWRRFNWDQVINNKLPAMSYKDDNYISLSGKAYKNNSSFIIPNTSLYAFITTKDSASDFLMLQVDSSGSFHLPGLIFNDTATIAFQQVSAKDKNVSIGISFESLKKQFSHISSPYSRNLPPISTTNPYAAKATKILQYFKDEKDLFVTLQSVQLSSAKKISKTSLVQSRYATGPFSTYASHVYDLVTNPVKGNPYNNVFDYLRRNGTNLTVNGFLEVQIRNTRSFSGPVYATLFLDGVETPGSNIAIIPFREIALVKVYSNGFVGAEGGGAGGAVAIFTKKGEDRNLSETMTLNTIKLEGFSPVKEFYSPDYSTTSAEARVDKRTTLYWNPYISTNSTNKDINVSFFNADNAGAMKLVLTGFTADGKLLYLEKIIE